VDLNVDSVLVTSGGREFHVRDAAAGKARSPVVRTTDRGVSKELRRPISMMSEDNVDRV